MIHMEEKPQTKYGPQDDKRQTAIMDHPFLMTTLRSGCGINIDRERRSIPDEFSTLITIVVAFWHLCLTKRTRLHHRRGHPQVLEWGGSSPQKEPISPSEDAGANSKTFLYNQTVLYREVGS